MNKMSYLQYIFSDKKSGIYWTIILLLITILTFLSFLISWTYITNLSFWGYFDLFFYFILFLIIYLGFYASGYIKFKLQERFKVSYKSKIENFSIHEVVIYHEKLTVKPFRQNNDMKVSIQPRKDYYQFSMIGETLIIFGHVYDFGVFKRHIKPLQIELNNSNVVKLKFTIRPSVDLIEINKNELEIKFKKCVSGINKLVIKDFE